MERLNWQSPAEKGDKINSSFDRGVTTSKKLSLWECQSGRASLRGLSISRGWLSLKWNEDAWVMNPQKLLHEPSVSACIVGKPVMSSID